MKEPTCVTIDRCQPSRNRAGNPKFFFLSMLTAMRHDMAELVDVDPESNTTTKVIMPVLVK